MATDKLGVTVMELFAYNPYRILGIAVDSTQKEIDQTYHALLAMCENGTIDSYKSPFDFPSLPSFERNSDSLETAYNKLSGDVYRCFAFSESLYAVNLSRADVEIQISNIDSYDKFLSCYMWLIINDRRLTYKNLWFKISRHIDSLICSTPDEWEILFDHRFPKEVYKDQIDILKGFYTTFSEIILLPMKELVKGSIDAVNASEILSIALFDGDVTAFMSELKTSEKKSKKVIGRKAPQMPTIAGLDTLEATEESDEAKVNVGLVESATSDEENIYTEALNRMIKSNRAKNQEIKSVDTSKVFGGGNLGKEEEAELTMDKVNVKVYDEAKLYSPYDLDSPEGPQNVDISDMLNPQISFSQKGIADIRDRFATGEDVANDIVDAKLKRKGKALLKFTIFVIIVATLVTLGIVFWNDIVELVRSLLDK